MGSGSWALKYGSELQAGEGRPATRKEEHGATRPGFAVRCSSESRAAQFTRGGNLGQVTSSPSLSFLICQRGDTGTCHTALAGKETGSHGSALHAHPVHQAAPESRMILVRALEAATLLGL